MGRHNEANSLFLNLANASKNKRPNVETTDNEERETNKLQLT